LTFLHAYGAIVVWTGIGLWRARRDRYGRSMMALHAAPIGFLVTEYVVFVRHVEIGGGPHKPLFDVLGETLAWTFGTPHVGWVSAIVALVVGSVLVLDIKRSISVHSDEWILTLGAALVVPGLTLIAFHPDFIAPRYFLTSALFLLLALARLAAGNGALARMFQAVAIASVIGNSLRIAHFLKTGRGHVSDALEYVVDHTHAPIATLASPDDYLLFMTTEYYGRRLPATPKLELHPHDALPVGGTEWILLDSTDPDPNPSPAFQAVGVEYALARTFTYYGQSGISCMLYHRVR
jgi:hypothetical protein